VHGGTGPYFKVMTILFDIRPLTDEKYSGIGEYTFRLLTALLERDSENRYILFYNAFKDVSRRLPDFSKYQNVRVVRRRFPNKIFNYALLWFWGRPRFDKLVKEKVDIFFMPHINFAAVSKNVKSVVAIHDLSFLVNPEFFSWRKNAWHSFVNVKKLVKRFNRVVAVSKYTQQDLIEVCGAAPQKVTAIYSGLDESLRPINKDSDELRLVKEKYSLRKPFILFLATLEPRKNVEGLVKAFDILKSSGNFPDLELVLAGGRGWRAAPIFKAIKEAKFSSDIKVLNYIDSKDRAALYNLAAVFAYPSFYEGFGFPPLEAMACGTPVVAAANSSLPELLESDAVLVDAYNPSSIAEGLKEVLSDNALASELSARGLKKAAAFSWEKTAEQYLELFAKLVS